MLTAILDGSFTKKEARFYTELCDAADAQFDPQVRFVILPHASEARRVAQCCGVKWAIRRADRLHLVSVKGFQCRPPDQGKVPAQAPVTGIDQVEPRLGGDAAPAIDRIGRLQRPNNFNQLHYRHRIHEVHTYDLIWTLSHCCNLRD